MHDWNWTNVTFRLLLFRQNSQFITLAFTGLKDKTGKEIYEGDIVEYRYYKGFSGIENIKVGKIEFIDGRFGFFEYYQSTDDYYFNTEDLSATLIIGNIYENPELLEIKEAKNE